MLHNKFFEVLKQFVGDYNKELYGRELIGRVRMSQKAIALALQELEEKGVLSSETKGNIKFYRLNFRNNQIKDMINITEVTKKTEFFSQHRKIAQIFKDDSRIVGIFGSYAKGTQKAGSDVDVFAVGKKKQNDYGKVGKLFDLDVSVKHFSEKEFAKLLQQKNNLVKEILESHVLIFGIEKFIDMVWRYYYGFN